jgi:hypothetical protein
MTGFRVLSDDQIDQRIKQSFAPFFSIVNEFKKTKVKKGAFPVRFHCADAPASQKRPGALHRINMDFIVPIPIIPSILSFSMIHILRMDMGMTTMKCCMESGYSLEKRKSPAVIILSCFSINNYFNSPPPTSSSSPILFCLWTAGRSGRWI